MLDGFGMFRSLRSPTHQFMALPSVKGMIASGEHSALRCIQFIAFPSYHQLGVQVNQPFWVPTGTVPWRQEA